MLEVNAERRQQPSLPIIKAPQNGTKGKLVLILKRNLSQRLTRWSVGKGACYSLDQHDGRGEPTPESCPMTSTCMPRAHKHPLPQ